MSQSSLIAPQNAPEPWNFSSTNTRFSGEFLLQKIKLLWDWFGVHGYGLSMAIGLFGVILTGITWGEFRRIFDEIQVRNSEITAPTATKASPAASLYFDSSVTSSAKLRAHIAGAVRKPGVYELSNSSVVQDLVIAAGGLSGLVWQDYLDEYINLAAPLVPNQKVWIPTLAQRQLLEYVDEPTSLASFTAIQDSAVATESGLLSINTATVVELDTLAGIGLKRAEDIVANRPYITIDELTSKAGMPVSIVNQLRNQLKL